MTFVVPYHLWSALIYLNNVSSWRRNYSHVMKQADLKLILNSQNLKFLFFFSLSLSFFFVDLNLDGIELGALKGCMSSIVKRDQCIHEKRVQSYFSSVHSLSRVRLFDP